MLQTVSEGGRAVKNRSHGLLHMLIWKNARMQNPNPSSPSFNRPRQGKDLAVEAPLPRELEEVLEEIRQVSSE